MFQALLHRAGPWLLLVLIWAALHLPNLGRPSLWDIDEGNNAEAAYEMRESGNPIVPTFNYRLRPDKPPLLYWLQVAAYEAFGVNEFAARLPSALASLLTLLLTYELGRLTFGPGAGFLAGLILASTVAFCAAGHFANPDALLNVCTILTLYLFWRDYVRGKNGWLVWTGISTGLGMLAKGPVGLVLPSAVVWVFLFRSGQWRRGFRLLLLGGVAAFLLVAAPWYVWVGVETKGQWLREFFLVHNWDRATGAPMENHGGPIFYYVVALIAGFAPWSVFFALTLWQVAKSLFDREPSASETPFSPPTPWERGVGGEGDEVTENLHPSPPTPLPCVQGGGEKEIDSRAALRFLLGWIAVYFLIFSLARTKLPNYVLPLYAPLALLMGNFLDLWRRGNVHPPAWLVQSSWVCLALLGVGLGVGLLVAGGAVDLPLGKGRSLPGLEVWAWLGGIPLLGAAAAWWLTRRQRVGRGIAMMGLSAVVFTGSLAAWGAGAVERYKAPRELLRKLPADQLDREVRIATLDYFQPSLVFYCHREVARLEKERQAIDFLRSPLPAYLILPEPRWESLRPHLPESCRLLGRRRDLYKGYDVVLVSNE
jgi:4-amino-4-deoxy-L-arabinose transferase-like glycosyltransferase